MATAGKAVLMSGLTVIAALLAVMLVPVPAFRSVPLGIALAVTMVLAATLTLLPAALARLGHRINRGRVRIRGAIDHRSERFAAWGRRLWARPLPYGAAAAAILLLLAAPALGLQTGMPTAGALPATRTRARGSSCCERGFGDGAANALQIVVDEPRRGGGAAGARAATPASPAIAPAERSRGHVLLTAVPDAGTDRDRAAGDDRPPPRRAPRRRAARRRRPPRPATSSARSSSRLPLVVGVILGLGFVLLVALLRAPLAAAAAIVLSLLATAAAFGVARLVFQDGALDPLLGWESQGFVDAWAPIFFFALVFALAMDYSVFLLATVKAVYDRTGRRRAMRSSRAWPARGA